MLAPTGGEIEDPLGLDVENCNTNFPEEQLLEMFPESNGDIGSERFDPAYFLLEHHHATTFDDLKVRKLKRRKVHYCVRTSEYFLGWSGASAKNCFWPQPEPAVLHQV